MQMPAKRPVRSSEAGVTLLEILVVLSIVALLAAVIGPSVVGYLTRAKSQTAGFQLDSLKTSTELFFVDVGRYPSTDEGLNALISPPGGASNWNGPYIEAAEALTDPWGRPYLYQSPSDSGREFQITTHGADGVPGGADEDADQSR